MKKLTRRNFMIATTTAAAGACLCGLGGCLPTDRYGKTPEIKPEAFEILKSGKKIDIIVETQKIPDLLNEGKAYKIKSPQLNDSIIANTGENQFVALSISCTHNAFEVEYKHDNKRFRCISINHAEFDLDGKVIGGQTATSQALRKYPINQQSGKLIVQFV